MLTSAAAAAVAFGVTLAAPTVAYADSGSGPGGGPVQVSGDYHSGVVTTVVRAPSRPGRIVHVAASTGSGTSPSTCSWRVIYTVQQLPLPYPTPGSWYAEDCGGPSFAAVVFVPDRASNRPAVRATPATVAEQAANRLPLPLPAARHNPPRYTLVNLATWWWVDPAQWRPLSQRTRAGAVWARVTARPVRSVWDAGDGTLPLTCTGGGTPYDTHRRAEAQSTNCSHVYRRSSAGQPQTGPDPNDRYFTVTVTVYWQISYVGAGGVRGTLPMIARTTSFPLAVDEMQAVVTNGSG